MASHQLALPRGHSPRRGARGPPTAARRGTSRAGRPTAARPRPSYGRGVARPSRSADPRAAGDQHRRERRALPRPRARPRRRFRGCAPCSIRHFLRARFLSSPASIAATATSRGTATSSCGRCRRCPPSAPRIHVDRPHGAGSAVGAWDCWRTPAPNTRTMSRRHAPRVLDQRRFRPTLYGACLAADGNSVVMGLLFFPRGGRRGGQVPGARAHRRRLADHGAPLAPPWARSAMRPNVLPQASALSPPATTRRRALGAR